MTEYTIIIPVYNESEIIGKVLEELGKPKGCWKIIVVDDGSTDDTAKIASQYDVSVISLKRNKGYGAALKAGILKCETDYVICFDGDGQHKVEDLLKVAEVMGQYDMVLGVRDKKSVSCLTRTLGKKLLGLVANILTKQKILDFNSGLRSFRTSTIKKYLHLMPDGFSMSTTSTIAMYRMGFDVGYVPIVVTQREGRRSSVRFFEDGIKTLMLIINLTVLFNPMRVFLPLSFFFVASSILYFILFCIYVRVHVSPSMVLLFITGVLTFFLGVVCEQISAVRRELHK